MFLKECELYVRFKKSGGMCIWVARINQCFTFMCLHRGWSVDSFSRNNPYDVLSRQKLKNDIKDTLFVTALQL